MLAACAGTSPATQGGGVELLLLGTGDGALYQQMLPRFEAAHPGIRVRLTLSQTTRQTSLPTSLIGGHGPDVFWVPDPAPYLAQPLLLDLSALAAHAQFDFGAFSGPLLASCRQGTALRLLPRSASPGAYAIRTDLFAAAGLNIPSGDYTAEAMAAAWARLTGRGRVGGELRWSPTSSFYFTGWGAYLVDPANYLRSGLASTAAISCGQWMWNRFWVDGSARGQQGQNAGASFLRGTLAMRVLSCAGLPSAASAYRNLAWRLAPFPVWPARPATFADVDYYAISATTGHPRAAWLLLAYLTSSRWESAAITTSLVCPARTALWPAYLAAVRRAAPPLAQQPVEIFSTALQHDYAYPPQLFHYQTTALAVLQPFWQQIFGQGHTLTVSHGFPQAAVAVAAAERRAAVQADTVPGGAPPAA